MYYGRLHNVVLQDSDSQKYILQTLSPQYKGRGTVRTERLLPSQGAAKRKQKKGGLWDVGQAWRHDQGAIYLYTVACALPVDIIYFSRAVKIQFRA